MYLRTAIETTHGLDAAANRVRRLMLGSSASQISALWRQIDLSTIFHDCGLEGQVLSPEEIDGAFNCRAVTDASSLQIYQMLHSHQRAISLARALATRPRLEYSIELFRDLHALFATDNEDPRGNCYRREIPLHRTYFHEICEPDKILQNLRKLVEWLNDPHDARELHPIERAARFHLRFMKVFPFLETSGKVARTLTNLMLVRHGYLPAIIHATERQRYYEAIRLSGDELADLIIDSSLASLEAAEKFLRRAIAS